MTFSALGGWFFAYMLPGLSVLAVIYFFPKYRSGTFSRGAIVHCGLIISTILSQYLLYTAGRPFPWGSHPASIISETATSATTAWGLASALSNIGSSGSMLFFGAVAIAVFALLGRFGIFYALSALLQQLTMTSVAYYLFGSLSFLLIVLLVVPFFSLSHLLQRKHWRVKIPVTFAWGFFSLALFALYGNLFLNASLHAALVSLLIYAGVMYPHAEFAIKRVKLPTAGLKPTDLI